ncbi:Alpha/Beta hydrolase protein [Phycomyces blakesleeanus]|uniref:Alpha/Beta hydrolase protein n=1 Tax=Phycomyces blakesleeanus TaxID=4837 RepID=A0ABR3BFK0_PHYBL
MEDKEIRPFIVPSFSPEKTRWLQERLKTSNYPNELTEDVGWTHGAPRWAVEPLAKIWAHGFDWEIPRAKMNSWRHYHTTIDDINLHFVHEPSSHKDAIPILLLHGWPSTFYEFHKIIEPLRDGVNGGQAFHVVVPSLPGYGFSEPPKKSGYGVVRMASIINTLMLRLGYNKYMLQGGDWGGIIGKYVASHYSENCKAFHTGFPYTLPPLPTPRNILLHPFKIVKFFASLIVGFDRIYGEGSTILGGATFANAERNNDCGYRSIQGTRPYTLAYGLSDSPLGLLGWMLEKYHNWAFHPEERKDADALPDTIHPYEFLTQVSIYLLTNTMSSSIRIYYECLQQNEMMKVIVPRVEVPVAVCAFAHDIARLPEDWLKAATNLHQYSKFVSGGHFPALEEAKLLTQDVQQFGKTLRNLPIFPKE